jgi:maleate isomerase
LSPRDAADRITSRWQNRQADAYLITGTGLPTLRVVAELSKTLPGPVLSSNLCLAWATLRVAGIDPGALAPTPQMPLLAGWEPRIDQL